MPAKATPIGNNLPASQLAHVAVALRIKVILPAIRCTNHDTNKTPAKRTKNCNPSINGSMDLVGIENAEVWETAALFRYKSRRSFLEIVTHPDMYSKHKYKIAALEKTIAFPVENQFYLGDPRLLLGFILLIIGLLLRPVTRQ